MTDELWIVATILLMPVILVMFVVSTHNWRVANPERFVVGLWICLGAILVVFAALAAIISK